MFSSKDLFFTPAASGAYTVSKSLRFRSSASAYLNRTFASGNRKTWTWSGWVKLGATGQQLFGGGTPASNWGGIEFDSTNYQFYVRDFNGSANDYLVTGTPAFRDFSAWYHLVVKFDDTQATAANRVVIYVNGSSIATSGTYPTQNTDYRVNSATEHRLMRYMGGAAAYFDGYLAEVNFIGGSALTPTSFGAYDTNGIWQPIAYTGSYSGTNSFYLKFTDTTSTTTLVADSSGNGNNWTPNNISLTAGVTYDSMLDSPTNATGDIGNYAVLNPIGNPNGPITTYSSGNLDWANAGSAGNAPKMTVISTIGLTTGKWYFEQTPGSNVNQKIGFSNAITVGVARGTNYFTYVNDGTTEKSAGITITGSPATYTTNDVIGVAIDIDAGTATFYKDNASQATVSGIPAGTWFAYAEANASASASGGSFNFGQRGFVYTPPSNYSALNTQNLTTPTITNGASYMAATLWTGNASARAISNGTNNTIGTTFQSDFVWVKSRTQAIAHRLVDVVRGATLTLSSNLTNAEYTDSQGVTAFNATGFNIGTDTSYNNTGDTYVGWNWKAGGTGVTNTSGSITSLVSANTSAGFSVVTAQSASTTGSASVGHGLGVTPSLVIFKNRDIADDWYTWHVSLGSSVSGNYIRLNTTAAATSSANIWGGTGYGMTSTTLGFNQSALFSASNQKFVFYAFAPISGYSAFGAYTGNGSTDGPFVYTGFRPRWIMVKNTSAAESWILHDTSRNTYNVSNLKLSPNNSGAESTSTFCDVLSNGFKLRTSTAGEGNDSGSTYIYAAFAENPFKISRAR